MPLLRIEEFLAKLQKNNWIRLRYKLELGEFLGVYVQDPGTFGSGSFHARLTRTVALLSPRLLLKSLKQKPEMS